jgi:hypothetical protein
MLNTETDKTAMDMQHKKKESRKLALLILVASLGYFQYGVASRVLCIRVLFFLCAEF